MNREELYELVDNAIDNVFGKYQDAEGITSGDIAPLDSIKLDSLIDQVTDLIISSMEHNKPDYKWKLTIEHFSDKRIMFFTKLSNVWEYLGFKLKKERCGYAGIMNNTEYIVERIR